MALKCTADRSREKLKSRTARRAAASGGAEGILEFNFSLRSNVTVAFKE
jgi:hypothetical protein